MKTLTKTTKAILLAFVAAVLLIATALTLTACNDGDPEDGLKPGTYQYEASLDASITMGNMGSFGFGDVLDKAYVTYTDGEEESYTLTLVFKTGELTVGQASGTIFVDSNPSDPKTDNNGITDGTIGVYQNGELVTEGVTLTYSSGTDYVATPSNQYVYYVCSASFPVSAVQESYSLALYINSNMMGQEFNNDTFPAAVTLDLSSPKKVTEISGLGVETLATVPVVVEKMTFTVSELADTYHLALFVAAFNDSAASSMQFPYTAKGGAVSNAELKIDKESATAGEDGTHYEATLDAVVTMGNSDVNFTENLIDSVVVNAVDGGYEVSVIFKVGDVNMPYGNLMTGYVNNAVSTGYGGAVITPVFGYYEGETLVEDITLVCRYGVI